MDRFDAGTQPAGRPPAPGRLAFVQAFLNTFWDLDGDGAEAWSHARRLRRRGCGPAASAARRVGRPTSSARSSCARRCAALCLRQPRRRRRAGGAGRAGPRSPRAVAPAAALAPSLRTGALEPAGDGPDAACALALGIVFAARADGTFARLKACPHAHCGWAFYDASRNRSGQWCSMRICGNRTKGEAFRRRSSARRP